MPDGAALFARLQSVAGADADVALYFDEWAGWDIDALLSDMSVYGLDLGEQSEPSGDAHAPPQP
eukprot:scaffold123331_cov29-Tisochrysis_lutea.AAC.1